MCKIFLALLLASLAPLTLLAQQAQQTAAPAASATDAKVRAQEVLKQARAAIWNEAKSKPLQSLSITANSRNMLAGNEIPIDMTVEALFPDKFLQTLVPNLSNMGLNMAVGFDITALYAFNGSQSWSDLKSSNPELINRFGSNRIMGMMGGMAGVQTGQFNMDSYLQTEFARLLMVWLLATPAALPFEFTYVGEAKAEGKTADVLDAKGPNNFTARIFIDQQTHQFLMLSYKTKSLNLNRGSQAPGQGNRPADGNRNTASNQGNQGNQSNQSNQGNQNNQANRPANPPTPEEIEKMRAAREKQMKELQAALANAPEVETRWIVSDYRNVNGLNLPHHLIKSTQGQVSEEIQIQKVKVNPSLKPDKFEQKSEKKK